MNATEWADGVRERLRSLSQILERQGREPFTLNDPLDEAAVAAFEREHGATLPDDYRAFVTRVANGAPGPDYGIDPLSYQPFDAMPSVVSTVTTKDGQTFSAGTGDRPALGRASRLDHPFALEKHWVPVDDQGQPNPLPVADDANLYDGVLQIGEIGCGYFYFLIVTGERRGEAGVDYTAGNGSVGPLELTFRDWYDRWLNDSLAYGAGTVIDAALKAGQWTVDPLLAAQVPLLETSADPHSGSFRLATLARGLWYLGERKRSLAVRERLVELADGALHLPQLEAILFADDLTLAAEGDVDELAELLDHAALAVRRRLFENDALDSAALSYLAADEDASIRLEVAAHSRTPAEALTRLTSEALQDLEKPDATVLRDALWRLDVLARQPDLPVAALAELSALVGSETGPETRSVIARSVTHRADTTPEQLAKAAAHEAPWVRHAAAAHAASPAALLADLTGDTHWAVQAGAAASPRCPPEALQALVGDGWTESPAHTRVWSAVGANPRAPEPTLLALYYSRGYDYVHALCRNPALPEAVMLAMARDLDDANVLGLWEREDLPETVKEALRSHWSDYIRKESAQRERGQFPPYVGKRAWWTLPDDAPIRDAMTIEAGVYHPSYPVVLLRAELARAVAVDRPTDALALVSSPWCDESLLAELALHPYGYTRRAVAAHPLVTVDILVGLADDPTGLVRGAVAANAKTPLEIVERYVEDPGRDARSGVAKNPRAKPEWLARLIDDEDAWVRRDAAQNPRTSAGLIDRLAGGEPGLLWQLALAPNIDAAFLERLAEHDDPKTRNRARWRLAGDGFRLGLRH